MKKIIGSINNLVGVFTFFIMFFIVFPANSQINGSNAGKTEKVEKKISDIINKMTLEEKVWMCVGGGPSSFKGVERLGIPDVNCTDGPRGPHRIEGGTTAFPTGVAFASTWNPDLIYMAGVVMGKETRAINAGVLLGPGINILRDPLGGRFFEYYSEDPYLNSKLTASIVKGIQSQKVSACIKHYVCNNRENNRNEYMAMVDERSLREIYLPAFKAGVDAGAMTVMTSANGVNDDFVSDNAYLLNNILKQEWGFKGMVITDWLNTRSTEKAAFAGLDVGMPYNESSLFGKPLIAAVKEGRVPESIVDDKVRRILRVYAFIGILDNIPLSEGSEINTKAHQNIALKIAEESMVLLKNDNNILPLDRKKIKKIVVLGPNANQRFCLIGLGGSSWMESTYEVTALEGIRKAAGKNVKVEYVSTDAISAFKPITAENMTEQNGVKGFLAQYYNDGDKKPQVTRMENSINFVWEMRSPDLDKINTDYFNAKFSGWVIPPVTGLYTLRITADNMGWLGEAAPMAIADIDKGNVSATSIAYMEAGKPFRILVNYHEKTGDAFCRLEWSLPKKPEMMIKAMETIDKAVSSADVVVFVGGIDYNLDSEGRDRTDINFPPQQEELIKHAVEKNPNTIVTLINGSPLNINGWFDKVPAFIEAWYPGMEGGTALGNILFGDVNPSGRLPFTWPLKIETVPMHAIKSQNWNRVDYVEGVFVGYRYFETWNKKVLFPFGYGLSYSLFDYKDLNLSTQEIKAGDSIIVTANITNKSNRKGIETVQLYIHDERASVARPVRELKGFARIELYPNETKSVRFTIDKSSLAFYDILTKSWKAEPGVFEVQIGSSAHDIKLKKNFKLVSN